MNDSTPTLTSDPPTQGAEAARPAGKSRSPQPSELANAIAEAERLITAASTHPDVALALQTHGYGPSKLAEGLDLHRTAQAAFAGRHEAMTARTLVLRARTEAAQTARAAFTDYRTLVRSRYRSKEELAALGARGEMPGDIQRFLTLARTAATSAAAEPYRTELAARGWGSDRVTAFAEALTTLATREAELSNATIAATAAKEARNYACAELAAWVSSLRQVAKVALRPQPALREALAA